MRGEPTLNHRANLTVVMDEFLLKQLKNEAEKNGHSINAKTNIILAKYLQFYRHVEEQRGIILPAEIWKKVVNLLDEKEMIEMLESAGANTFLILFEHNNIPMTMDNLIKYLFETMSLWAGCYHRFTSQKDRQGYTSLVFEHDFGIKWSNAIGTVFGDVIKKSLNITPEVKYMPSTVTIKIKL